MLKLSSFVSKSASVAVAALCLNGFAESGSSRSATPNTTVTQTLTAPVESQSGVAASLDFRPTYAGNNGSAATESSVELSYSFNPNRSIHLSQDLETNLYDPAPGDQGANVALGDTVVRGKFKNLAQDKANGLSFGFEPRAYLPVAQANRDNGMISVVRTYFGVGVDLGAGAKLTVQDAPFFHIYNSPTNAKGEANPIIGNRVALTFSKDFSDTVSFVAPVWWHVDHLGNVAGAKKSNTNKHSLMFYPEVDYKLNKNLAVGLAYRTDNLIQADLSDTSFGAGFQNGVTQLVFQASL